MITKKIMNNLEFSKMRPNFFMRPLEHDKAFFYLITAIQPNPEQLWLFWGGGGGLGGGGAKGREETVLTFLTIK